MATPERLDRLERLTDLVLVLLDAAQPLSLDAIAQRVPGYPAEHDARRQAFERDKRLLRDEGIPVMTERIEGHEQFGYRIDPDAFYLTGMALEPDEQAALHLAVAGVHLGDPSGRHALLKLGATGLAETRPLASFLPPEALVDLFEAIRSRAEVSFDYRGARRRVSAAGLWFRHGHWYLVGWDPDRQAGRTFRVDRVQGAVVPGPPGSATLPEGFDAASAVPDEPWRARGAEGAEVLLRVDAIEGPRLVDEVGEQAVVERADDGSVTLRLGVSSTEAMRSWVLGLLGHAEVLGPAEMRREMVDWLELIVAAAGPAGPPGPAPAAPAAPAVGPGDGAGDAPSPPARVAATRDPSQRLRRLLAIVGWLAHVEKASIAEISARFEIEPDELVGELELAACCGLPPYSPDVLMEIVVDGESVQAFLPPDMARPRRLTAAEGFALAAAARMILAVPGADESGALARALAKLDAALGHHEALVVDVDAPALLAAVRQATEAGQQLEIEYHSASSDETTTRLVDPGRVLLLDGHWYLDGYCHRAGGVRRFRVDRIRRARPTGQSSAPPGAEALAGAGADSFVPGPGATVVQLALAPEAAWVADSLPVLAVEPGAGGGSVVTLAVGGEAFLERLLLQLGPAARVVGPPELGDLGPEAARRVLALYRP